MVALAWGSIVCFLVDLFLLYLFCPVKGVLGRVRLVSAKIRAWRQHNGGQAGRRWPYHRKNGTGHWGNVRLFYRPAAIFSDAGPCFPQVIENNWYYISGMVIALLCLSCRRACGLSGSHGDSEQGGSMLLPGSTCL